MFNRTEWGDASPVLPIDFLFPAGFGSKAQGCKLVAPRTRILLRSAPASADVQLQDGCIALYQLLRDGRRQILDILGPGALLGLSVGDIADCDAETLTFTQIRPVAPLADVAIGAALKQMLRRSQALATLLGRKTAQEKVASAVLDLAERFTRPFKAPDVGTTTFTLYLTRADLADWLGLTFETVSRCLNSFKRGGLIRFSHPEIITITDRDALRFLASGAPSPAQPNPAPAEISQQPS